MASQTKGKFRKNPIPQQDILSAGERSIYTLVSGQNINLKLSETGAATMYLLDADKGGLAYTSSRALKPGDNYFGAYSGTQKILAITAQGSIDAVVGDAAVGAAIGAGASVGVGGKRSVAIFGPTAALAQKGLADQTASVRAGIDTYNTSQRFVELWADTSAWAKGAQPFVVSGGKMYAGASAGGGANGNHSFASAVGDKMRWSVGFTLPDAAGTGSLIIGFDKNAPGATPSNGASSVSYGVEFNLAKSTGVRKYVDGVVSGLFGGYPGSGNFALHAIPDANWLSFSIYNDDTATEAYYWRVLRAGVTINNLFLFNSDSRQLAGASINSNGARAAIQPALAGQAGGVGQFSQYTGSDANTPPTVGYHIWGPAGYDPRRAYPLIILFHGDGSDENFFTTPALSPIKNALTAAGYLVAACGIAANKSTWGAQASIDAYAAFYQYVLANYSIGPVSFLAVSMGGIESLNCLASKKIPGVVAWAGLAPTANLAAAYARIEFKTKIDTAYGISGTTGQNTYALRTDGYDPLLQTDPHVFQDLPMMFVAPTDDLLVDRTLNTDLLKAKVAPTAAEIVDIPGVTGGHSFDAIPYAGQIVAFFDKYAK